MNSLQQSGAWRRYYSEESLLIQLGDTKREAEQWWMMLHKEDDAGSQELRRLLRPAAEPGPGDPPPDPE